MEDETKEKVMIIGVTCLIADAYYIERISSVGGQVGITAENLLQYSKSGQKGVGD